MLKIIRMPNQLNIDQLIQVYSESIGDRMRDLHRDYSTNERRLLAESEFNTFWKCEFFKEEGALCAVWIEEDRYISVLRLQAYADGLLLTGMETAPEYRNKGAAKNLLCSVKEYLKKSGNVNIYSHISKRNLPSIHVHYFCGFTRLREGATFLDGSVSWSYDTYILKI